MLHLILDCQREKDKIDEFYSDVQNNIQFPNNIETLILYIFISKYKISKKIMKFIA